MTREEEILNQLVGLFGAADQQPKNTEVVFSKRQLNIAENADKRYLGRPEHQYYSAKDLAKAFRDGAEWVEEHPQDVWHETSEKPQDKDKRILTYSKFFDYFSVDFPNYLMVKYGGQFKDWETVILRNKISK